MTYIAKWIVKNTKKHLIYTSLQNFWDEIEPNDESIMVQHSVINRKYATDRGGFLANDGETILYWMEFKDEDDYKKWYEEFKKLPSIDTDLEYTKVDKMDIEKYIPYRDGKPFSV